MRTGVVACLVVVVSLAGCRREPDVSVNIAFEPGLLERVAEPVEIGFLENPVGDQGEYIPVAADDPNAYTYVSLEGVDLNSDRITLVRPGPITESLYWVVARSGEADGRRIVARGVEQLLFSNQQVSRETIVLHYFCSHESAREGDACSTLGSSRSICFGEAEGLACKPSFCGDGYVDTGARTPEICDGGVDANGMPVSCNADCTLAPPLCGDGFLNSGREDGMTMEECDDGNVLNDDACVDGCKLATCGDGFVNATLNNSGQPEETCDEGDTAEAANPNDLCHECSQTHWEARSLMETTFAREDISLRLVADVAGDLMGNLYVLDGELAQVFRIQPVNGSLSHPDVQVELVAGAGTLGTSASGASDESRLAMQIRLLEPVRIAVDGVGNLYILDHIWNESRSLLVSRVVKVDTQGLAEVIYETPPPYGVYRTLVTDIAVDGVGTIYLGRGDPSMDDVGSLTILEPREGSYSVHDWVVPKPDEVVYFDLNALAYDPISHALLMTFWEGQAVYVMPLGSSQPWYDDADTPRPILADSMCSPYRIEISQLGTIVVTDAPGEDASEDCRERGNVVVMLEPAGDGTWTVSAEEQMDWTAFATDAAFSADDFVRMAPFAAPMGDHGLLTTDDSLIRVTVGFEQDATDLLGSEDTCVLSSARATTFGRVADVVGTGQGELLIADAFDRRFFVVRPNDDAIFGIDAGETGCSRVTDDAGGQGFLSLAVEADGDVLALDGCLRAVKRISASDGGALVDVDGCRPDVLLVGVAGGDGPCITGSCVDGFRGDEALFGSPTDLVLDASGDENLYIVDGSRVYRMMRGSSGELEATTTLSLVVELQPLSDGSEAVIGAIAFDNANHLYVSDSARALIMRVSAGVDGHPAGEPVVIAGTGSVCQAASDELCGDGGLATEASFQSITGMWTDDDHLWVTDGARVRGLTEVNGVLRIMTVAGKITRDPTGGIGDGDLANAVRFGTLSGGAQGSVESDGYGYYVIDRRGSLVRGVRNDTNEVWTLAGPINWLGDCSADEEDCTGYLSGPMDVLGYEDPNMGWTWVVTDRVAKRIRGLWYTDTGGLRAETLAGYGTGRGDDDGFCESDCSVPAEVAPASARYSRLLEDPVGLAYDAHTGSLFVSEQDRGGVLGGPFIHCINTSVEPMQISVFAGAGEGAGYGAADATRDEAWFDQPAGLAVHETFLYVADSGNQVVRRIALHATQPCMALGDTEDSYGARFETWAGMPRQRGFLQDDGVDARLAYLNRPVALAFSPSGILYISDASNHRIRRVRADHTIETVIGNGLAVTSGDVGPAWSQSVDSPRALVVDDYGNLFFASRIAVRVVVAGPDGVAGPEDPVMTIYQAGQGTSLGSVSGCLSGLTLESLAGTTRVHVLDACRGSWVAIDRH